MVKNGLPMANKSSKIYQRYYRKSLDEDFQCVILSRCGYSSWSTQKRRQCMRNSN